MYGTNFDIFYQLPILIAIKTIAKDAKYIGLSYRAKRSIFRVPVIHGAWITVLDVGVWAGIQAVNRIINLL